MADSALDILLLKPSADFPALSKALVLSKVCFSNFCILEVAFSEVALILLILSEIPSFRLRMYSKTFDISLQIFYFLTFL